ncbi:MAG: winged helix-turn-helix transcriptional regulator [Candidatus Hodarchaeota archaeon]
MVQHATDAPKFDAEDWQIVGILIDDYLLYQSKEGIASQLGISRSNLSRRLDRLESTGVIKPMLNLRAADLIQTMLRILETEPQVLHALMCLPEVFFSTIELEEQHREWLVSVKSVPAIAEIIMQSTWQDGTRLISYGAQRVAFQSQ